LEQVVDFCGAAPSTDGPMSAMLIGVLFRPRGPRKQPGWLCAQKRPVEALYQLLEKYRNGLELPDYIIIVDDDTYLANVDYLTRVLGKDYPANIPFVVSPCPIIPQGFVHPYGGFGSILTRAAIQNLIHPINCSNTTLLRRLKRDRRSRLCCARLQTNAMGEKRFFRNGMSVADLMYEYSAQQPFSSVQDWSGLGFCMHSDHALAYFINSYYIALPARGRVRHPGQKIPLRTRHGYTSLKEKQCENERTGCSINSLFCHYVMPHQMDALFLEQYGSSKIIHADHSN
jgi:hypothetical protein